MKIITRYYWMELTEAGTYIHASWANPDGYEHSDSAIIHMHMRFTTDLYAYKMHKDRPQWKLEKFYGLGQD
jgi:hypothetical protein